MRLAGGIGCLLGAALVGLSPTAAMAQQGDLQEISDAIEQTGIRLQHLVAEYADPRVLEGAPKFGKRLTDAEILFLLGDYQRASLLLFELVNDSANKGEELYGKALYYLAESQFQMGNNLGARDYFRRLVSRREAENLTVAIRRLIEIADKTRQWEGLDVQVDVLRERGKLPPTIAYIHTKSLLRQGKNDAVVKAAEDIPPRHPVRAKIDYLVAVSRVQAGELETAGEQFEKLILVTDDFDDASRVRDLARMNRARVYMELGKIPEAIDAYQEIVRTSPYFEESLYEISWTHIRAAGAIEDPIAQGREYVKALKAIEILLLSETNSTLAPEARILLGNINLRLEKFDRATEAFGEVIERYEPVRKELKALTSEITQPEAYYDEIVERSRSGGGLLPPLAIRWAAEQDEIKKALGVVNDLEQGETWIAESRQVVDQLLTILDSDDRSQFFPTLQEARAISLEIENSLTTASYRLLELERELVQDGLDPARSAALAEVLGERERLKPEYDKLPKKKEDYEGRLDTMRGRMKALQKSAFRLKWEIEEMRRGIDGLRSWMLANAAQIDDTDGPELRARLDQADREVRELESTQKQLAAEIAKEKSLINVTTSAQDREEELRSRYASTLEREQEILAGARATADAEGQAILTGIEEKRAVISRYNAELASFLQTLSKVVADQAYGVKAKLLQEQSVLEKHAASILTTRGEAKRVVGEIAISSLEGVEKTFRNIVLRGDVGVIDVAWALKDRKTREISRQVSQQAKEVSTLDAEFAEVVE